VGMVPGRLGLFARLVFKEKHNDHWSDLLAR